MIIALCHVAHVSTTRGLEHVGHARLKAARSIAAWVFDMNAADCGPANGLKDSVARKGFCNC